jgi:DNA-nicking Smr family endonuclease
VTKKIISEEDSELFRQSIGKIRTLQSDKVLLSPQDKPKPFPKPKVASNEDRLLPSISSYDIESVGLEDSLSYLKPGLQKTVLKKLRQGYFGLDGELDLHGLNSNEAKRQLLFFLDNALRRKYRCVHIVHGKGYRSIENQPILKNNINLWLRQHQDVLAFCSASQKDGGTGAVFVLLRTKNDQ